MLVALLSTDWKELWRAWQVRKLTWAVISQKSRLPVKRQTCSGKYHQIKNERVKTFVVTNQSTASYYNTLKVIHCIFNSYADVDTVSSRKLDSDTLKVPVLTKWWLTRDERLSCHECRGLLWANKLVNKLVKRYLFILTVTEFWIFPRITVSYLQKYTTFLGIYGF